jgi:hypothetical protein
MGISLISQLISVENAQPHCSLVSLAITKHIAHCVNNRLTSPQLHTLVSIAPMIFSVVSAAPHPPNASSVTQVFISTPPQASAANAKCQVAKSVTNQIPSNVSHATHYTL